ISRQVARSSKPPIDDLWGSPNSPGQFCFRQSMAFLLNKAANQKVKDSSAKALLKVHALGLRDRRAIVASTNLIHELRLKDRHLSRLRSPVRTWERAFP